MLNFFSSRVNNEKILFYVLTQSVYLTQKFQRNLRILKLMQRSGGKLRVTSTGQEASTVKVDINLHS